VLRAFGAQAPAPAGLLAHRTERFAAETSAGADGASEATDASEEDSRASDSSESAQSWRETCRWDQCEGCFGGTSTGIP